MNKLILLPALLACGATSAAAQTDSVLAVSSGGRSLLRVNVNGNVGIATSAPDRRLVVDSGGVAFNGKDGFVAGSDYDDDVGDGTGSIPATGAGARMMWYARKAAFRVGYDEGTDWSDANTGYYSFAAGYGPVASGDGSVALADGVASGINGFAVRGTASGSGAVAIGGSPLFTVAAGTASFVFGANVQTGSTATSSHALGEWVIADDPGSFIWGDRSSIGTHHSSPGSNTFSVRAAGGVWFGSGAIPSSITSGHYISTGTGGYLSTGGAWTNSSDVSRKHRFQRVAGEDVLARLRAMPIQSWSYRAEPGEIRHLGPTAQDFRAAFGLGTDERSIATVDADGVALAAAQALTARTDALQAENAQLRQENADLHARVERIEALLAGQGSAPRQ